MKGFIVYTDYEIIDEKTIIKLFGRLENSQSFVTLNEIQPYFFIKENDEKKADSLIKECKKEKTNLTTFQKEKVIKIMHQNYKELNNTSKQLYEDEILTFESDIKPDSRFLMDNNILGVIDIQGDYVSSQKVDRVYHNPQISNALMDVKLKIISLDIETDEKNRLLCIGLYSLDYQENFMVGKDAKGKHITSCASEEECLLKVKEAIINKDPDIITGWNVIGFDFKYLQSLHKKYKIPFDWGRENRPIQLRIESNFFKSSSADIPGRLILDGVNLIKDPYLKEAPSIKNLEFESFSLEDVSNAILKKGKLIKGKNRHSEISQLHKKSEFQKLADYNLLDCQLAYEILDQTNLIDLAIERSKLTGMQLDRITASIAAFDSLYIREARKEGLVSPTLHFTKKDEKIKGGYVFSSKSGIYHNVVILDFKSLYPSVIRTFNIDPASFSEKKIPNSIESPNKVYFKNQEGILPSIIQKLHVAREQAKKEEKEFSNYAIKTIMNSFWGVLASPNCRYFNFSMASAITSFCRFIIQQTAHTIEKEGYKVIYSDTDSVFVETGLDKDKAESLGYSIQNSINQFYKDYVQKNYQRKSFLELEYDKLYLSMIIPQVRSPDTKKENNDETQENNKAAKKRYAGLIEEKGKEKLEIVGLEAIRGDWTPAAQEFQKELLLKAFKKQPVEDFIRNYVKDIKAGKMDNLLVYKKSIRKELDQYTKTTPPHVKAARLLDSLESNVIQYYMTLAGPEPIQKRKHAIDYEHYIEKQITPIANQILNLIDKNMDDLLKKSKQSKLF